MEDGGVKYTQEVELPNGHKWRQRADGGWCRFSKKTCYGFDKTRNRIRKNNASGKGGELGFDKTKTKELRRAVTGRKKIEAGELSERHLGTTSHQVPKSSMARVINDSQVVMTASNGNLIFFKNGTVVITSSSNIADVKTAFGRGGFIPSRHVGPGKLYPAGSTGLPEPPIILKDFIKQQAISGNPVVKIWP